MSAFPSIRQRHTWLHRWAGLILGWLLYCVFLTGTLSFFQEEITDWMTPERHGQHATPETPLKALAQLQQIAPQASQWTINLPNTRQQGLSIHWINPNQNPGFGRMGQSMILDPTTGLPINVRDTRGGTFLYRFHFELAGLPHILGRWIVGLAALFMLVALTTGIVIHKRLFKDFFTFRPNQGQRSWIDAHCAAGVLALPFHLMITYSGLILLMLILMPWGVKAAYQGNVQQYMAESGFRGGYHNARGQSDLHAQPAPLTDLAPLLAYAQQHWAREPSSIQISQPNTEHSIIELREWGADSLINRAQPNRLRFQGVTGALLEDLPVEAKPNAAQATYNLLSSLHMLRFADYTLRWLFFLSGFLGTAMIATGLILWSHKRQYQTQDPWGLRLVNILNLGVLLGLPIAIAGYWWANRLLSVDLPERAAQEIQYFFLAWLLCLLHASLRNTRQAWIEQLAALAVLLLGLPLFNFSLPHSHLLSNLWTGQGTLALMALTLLGFGATTAFACYRLMQKSAEKMEERTA